MKKFLITFVLAIAAFFIAFSQSVVINADGTVSHVINNGTTSTQVNPNGTVTTTINNGNTSTQINPDGTVTSIINNGAISTQINPNGTVTSIVNNGTTSTKINPDGTVSHVINSGNNQSQSTPAETKTTDINRVSQSQTNKEHSQLNADESSIEADSLFEIQSAYFDSEIPKLKALRDQQVISRKNYRKLWFRIANNECNTNSSIADQIGILKEQLDSNIVTVDEFNSKMNLLVSGK